MGSDVQYVARVRRASRTHVRLLKFDILPGLCDQHNVHQRTHGGLLLHGVSYGEMGSLRHRPRRLPSPLYSLKTTGRASGFDRDWPVLSETRQTGRASVRSTNLNSAFLLSHISFLFSTCKPFFCKPSYNMRI